MASELGAWRYACEDPILGGFYLFLWILSFEGLKVRLKIRDVSLVGTLRCINGVGDWNHLTACENLGKTSRHL